MSFILRCKDTRVTHSETKYPGNVIQRSTEVITLSKYSVELFLWGAFEFHTCWMLVPDDFYIPPPCGMLIQSSTSVFPISHPRALYNLHRESEESQHTQNHSRTDYHIVDNSIPMWGQSSRTWETGTAGENIYFLLYNYVFVSYKLLNCGLWQRVGLYVDNKYSWEHSASMFRTKSNFYHAE